MPKSLNIWLNRITSQYETILTYLFNQRDNQKKILGKYRRLQNCEWKYSSFHIERDSILPHNQRPDNDNMKHKNSFGKTKSLLSGRLPKGKEKHFTISCQRRPIVKRHFLFNGEKTKLIFVYCTLLPPFSPFTSSLPSFLSFLSFFLAIPLSKLDLTSPRPRIKSFSPLQAEAWVLTTGLPVKSLCHCAFEVKSFFKKTYK